MESAAKDQILILLASGFEESDVITVARRLRHASLLVVLVGLSANPLRGAYGLSLAPDRTLSQVEVEAAQAVMLPGGRHGVRQLAGDPRVHALLHQVLEQGGYVLALDTARVVLYAAGVLGPAGEDTVEILPIAWDGQGLTGERVTVTGQVIFGRASSTGREAARALASLLQTR